MIDRIDFSAAFAKRMILLSCVAGLLICLVFPAVYLHSRLQDERNQAALRGEIIVSAMEKVIKENPELWYFDVPKFVEIIRTLLPGDNADVLRIYNDKEQLVLERHLHEPFFLHFLTKSPLHYNNSIRGYLEIETGLDYMLLSSSWLVIIFVASGLVLAAGVYRYPVSIVKKAEQRVCGAMQDLTAMNKKMTSLSITDGKTQLFNATYLAEQLKREIEQAECSGKPLSLLMLDIDYFKKYNDRLGHVQGDKTLQSIGVALLSQVRPNDTVGRYGGEEFMVLLPSADEKSAEDVAERHRSAVEDKTFLGEEHQPQGKLTISVGCVEYRQGMTPEQCVMNADSALYAAKEAGRNTVCIFRDDRITHRGEALVRVGDLTFASEDVTELLATFEKSAAMHLHSPHVTTLLVFLKALQSRENDTAEHSLLVNKISMAMGRQMQLSEKELLQLNWGTLLHDVGKLAMGDALLLKQGKLTESEYELVKTHPAVGYDMLKHNEYLDAASKVVLYHQERWDGRGYPYGLKGTGIPLLARICSVADAVSAMSADRPYRKALSHAVITGELQKNIGVQFDPNMVQCFFDSDYAF